MNNRQKTSLANRVLSLTNKARVLYQKKDDFFAQLVEGCAIGDVIETKNGRFVLVDNFATRHVGFRPASFHRFELKEIKTPKPVPKPAEPFAEAPAEPPVVA
jgi:hypothetical protein